MANAGNNPTLETRLKEIVGLTDPRCSRLWEILNGERPLPVTDLSKFESEFIAPFTDFEREHNPEKFLLNARQPIGNSTAHCVE